MNRHDELDITIKDNVMNVIFKGVIIIGFTIIGYYLQSINENTNKIPDIEKNQAVMKIEISNIKNTVSDRQKAVDNAIFNLQNDIKSIIIRQDIFEGQIKELTK